MAEMNIIPQGKKVKYIITSQNPVLDLDVNDFYIEIIYGMLGRKLTISKDDLLYGTDGEYIMMFQTNDMVGKLTARFVWQAHDTDSNPDGLRQEVDEQYIGFVVTTPCPKLFTCPACDSTGHDVRYEMTDEPDIAERYMRLCSTEYIIPENGEPYEIYHPLVTRDDEYIYVLREIFENDNN